jgi:hypothetical protein
VFDSTLFDVVVALVFVFFVFSLLVSGMNEGVRKLLNTRAKGLWTAIRRMLDEGQVDYRSDWTPVIGSPPTRETGAGMAPQDVPVGDNGNTCATLFDQFFNHPAISRLDPTPSGKASRLSHIPPTDFARAMVDILAPRDGNGDPQWDQIGTRVRELPAPLRAQLEILWKEAGHDVERFRAAVESWFDTGMERVSTWYKKRTRWAMLGYGLLVAVLFNVSAVVITADLYENDVVRDTVIGLAQQRVALTEETRQQIDETLACTDRDCFRDEVRAIADTGLPLFWRRCPAGKGPVCGFESGGRIAATIVGWLITAAALSMGASFWFAVLKKAFEIRPRPKVGPA